MIKGHIYNLQHAAFLCWVFQLSTFCVMGLFLAVLKVVVCFQQSPNPVEKKKRLFGIFFFLWIRH